MFAFDHVEPSDARADMHADHLGVFRCDFELRHLHRFIGGGDGEVDEAAHLLDFFSFDEFSGVEFDAVVPVPLHPSRQRERGYNQAELIARPLAKRLSIEMATYLLVRTRPRPAKSILTLKERWESVRGAYETRTGAKVDKLRILLVDDVFTTGATLDACARALRQAGAASVHGVTVARVVPELTPPRVTRVFRASNMEPERPNELAQAQ